MPITIDTETADMRSMRSRTTTTKMMIIPGYAFLFALFLLFVSTIPSANAQGLYASSHVAIPVHLSHPNSVSLSIPLLMLKL